MANVVGEKIVGGVNAEEGEAPFQVQLFRKTWSSASFLCGGSLISPRTVLSAGHCVTNSYYGVRYGSNSRLKSPYPELSLRTIIQHPNFTLATVQNDIALFILENAIQPGANVRAVELHTEELAEKDNMTLFGFGLVNGVGFKPAFNLQKADMQIVGEKECAEFIEKLDLGDSGGPLIAKESGRQAGVVSFGTRFCPEGSINVYTKGTSCKVN
ncbi:PREDICTED: mite allergen Der f 6-like, partial [Rhagoletis zephyria]|uniref:mite allergen Der f 6-like n=1 Tax=Rhagoletis zephyria TaxID=28612 RepID=UPI00081141C0